MAQTVSLDGLVLGVTLVPKVSIPLIILQLEKVGVNIVDVTNSRLLLKVFATGDAIVGALVA